MEQICIQQLSNFFRRGSPLSLIKPVSGPSDIVVNHGSKLIYPVIGLITEFAFHLLVISINTKG